MFTHRTAKGLGWLSIGIGLAELAATRMLTKAVRMEKRPGLVRMFGMRELATGVGILTQQKRTPWIWARVAGDVMDLATLGTSMMKSRRNRGRIAAALAAVAGVTALDVMCGRRLGLLSKTHLHT